MAQRLLGGNALLDALNSLVPSSEEPTLPATFLTDQLRQKPWRTRGPWVIVAGFNDRIDFNRGGAKVAFIPPGVYATGAALATAITTAINTADPTHTTWACDYNVGAAFKFRIRDTTGSPLNIVLNWATGPNKARSIGVCLGYNVTVDSPSAPSQTAAEVSHQSRHYLIIHRSPSAAVPTIAANVVVVLEHTATVAGGLSNPSPVSRIAIEGNATDVWSAPTFSEDLDNLPADPCPHYFVALAPGAQSHQYYRLLIDDVQNPIGYFELGILYLGTYVEPGRKIEAPALANEPDDFGAVETGIDGTHFVDEHRSRDKLSLVWKAVTPPDQVTLKAFFGALHIGEDFLFDLDPSDTDIKYGCFMARPKESHISTLLKTYSVTFFEAL